MRIKQLFDEDFVNYKLPSMFIGTCNCTWKCCEEGGFDKAICQNSTLTLSKTLNISNDVIYKRYTKNPITKALVVGGLEPMLQFDEIEEFINTFRRNGCNDDIVIYTGYYPEEIKEQINRLKAFKNIILKFGRYVPENEKHYDNILGIYLASDNQYAQRIEDIEFDNN